MTSRKAQRRSKAQQPTHWGLRLMGPLEAATVYSFASQKVQYPATGPVGISYFPGPIPGEGVVDCLLYRDSEGVLIGILNHYPTDMALEDTGNVNVYIDPAHKKQGVGTALVLEAFDRWPYLKRRVQQQSYSPGGIGLINSLIRKGIVSLDDQEPQPTEVSDRHEARMAEVEAWLDSLRVHPAVTSGRMTVEELAVRLVEYKLGDR